MGFFEKQAQAHRATLRLLIYFGLAIISMVLILNTAAYFAYQAYIKEVVTLQGWLAGPFWWLSGAIILTVAAGTSVRLIQLNKGGESLALLMGATPMPPSTRLPKERMLINVVEEMSIASGVPLPRIYIMQDEPAINAFVAGYNLDDMTLTVTQGALEQLSRDELQGVIGHEFSHIHNADTRLNIQIVSVLAGILLIGALGGFLCRSCFSRSRFSSRRDSRGIAAIFAIGAVLYVVGYTGLFFGRLIQAAISRQRELLADSSSVQFTRNPEGIASALFKIGKSDISSYLTATSKAQEVNHMCFGESLKLRNWFASHPPIDERIRHIDPQLMSRLRSRYNAEKIKQVQTPSAATQTGLSAGGISGFSSSAPSTPSFGTASKSTVDAREIKVVGQRISELAGTLPEESKEFGVSAMAELTGLFGENLHEADFCELILYALVLRETSLTASLSTGLTHSSGQKILELAELNNYQVKLKQLQKNRLMPLLEIAAGVLKVAPDSQRQHIVKTLKKLVVEDQKTTFDEFILLSFIARHLQPPASGKTISRVDPVKDELGILISMFANLGVRNEQRGQIRAPSSLFKEVSDMHFPLLPLNFSPTVSAGQLEAALNKLNQLSPLLKPALIDACAECIMHDGEVSVREYQLLRVVVELLGCPMPPVVPAQS